MKLMRVATDQVVAAWAKPNSGTKKKGKLRFMARDTGELGDEWEIMAVMSIVAILVKARRNAAARNAAAGGGGGS